MLVLYVSPQAQNQKDFTAALEAEKDVQLTLAGTGLAALELVKTKKPDVVILGEDVPDFTARELLLAIMQINAMINTAVASQLSDEAFHETYEGFGVLLRLPSPPGGADAAALIAKTRSVLGTG